WADLALRQIAERRRLLTGERAIWQRAVLGGAQAQKNWARACGWYLLGVARTFAALGRGVAEEEEAFVRLATWLMTLQGHDGLWSVYVEEPATGADTSGSAGIAAGLALGHRLGLLPVEALAAAQRMVRGAEAHLRPDGLLGGVAQLNRGGEVLQRGGYRVLAPFAMGLLAQARHA
ncbi:MAG: glycoside hydrolase family 88 protein, partial [Opitutaceae bacterium]|nr:glycoside hydrolase family 88 protein [Opitutaceae bacterium]